MPSSNSKEKRRRNKSGKRKKMRNIGKTFNTNLNNGAGTMPGATPLIHPKEGDLPAGLQPRLNKHPMLNNPGER